MQHINYKTVGTCSKNISFDIENGRVYNVSFAGGCPGNTVGVKLLVEGMLVEEVIEKLAGVKCGFKPTSCPDQLATALKKAMQQD